MHAILLSLTLFGQGEALAPPPAPAKIDVVADPAAGDLDQMKAWLLAKLVVDLSFDPQKSAEVKQLIDTMNEQQMKLLIQAYKDRSSQPTTQVNKTQSDSQQQSLDQTKLNLQQLEAYRDHLKREYDRQLLQGFMTQNLVYQNIVNNQRAMFMYNNPYAFSTLGYGSFGYGGLGYGGAYGYGVPGFGTSLMYGSPYNYGGFGY